MPRGYVSSTRTAAVLLGVLLVAANGLVRGGVDQPAIVLSSLMAAGFLALAPGRRTRDPLGIPVLAVGLGAATLVIALQIVPVAPWLVRALSPSTGELLSDVLGPIGLYPAWRPLSLDSGNTALELAKAATLTAATTAAAILASSDRRRDRLIRGIALVGVATVSLYYGAALAGRSPLLEPRITFVNPNHLAGFLQLAAWPALGFALRARGPARAGWFLAFAFTASGVFLSLSRGGITAFFIAGGIFTVLRVRAVAARDDSPDDSPGAIAVAPSARGDEARMLATAQRRGTPRRSGQTLTAAGISAALAIAAWLALDPILMEMRTVPDEAATEVKLGLWPASARIARDFPLAGIGRGAFATVYPAYKSDPARRTFTHIENEWLQLPVELGFVTGIGVIALFGWAFLAAARQRDLSRPLAGALAGAGALVAQNLFDFSLEIPGVAIPFAIVMGTASRRMPRLHVSSSVIRAAAGCLLVVASAGFAMHHAHPTSDDAAAVVSAPTADEATDRARDALRSHPVDYLPIAAAGRKLVSEGRCREALAWLTSAMRCSPTAPEPHRAIAWCLARAGQSAPAKQEYRLAFLLGDSSALDEANVMFPGALLEIAPDTPAGLLAAGRILRAQPVEAQEAWQRAWESFGETAALAQLASAKLALGEPREALALARQLQQAAPRVGAGYVLAAHALDALDRRDDAQAELETGASRLPGQADVLVQLGLRHLSKRRFSLAKSVFESIVAKEGGAQARKRILVARALEGQGRYQEALREASVARDISPQDTGALELYSRLAAIVGRYDEAIEALELAARQPFVPAGTYDSRLAELRVMRDERRIRLGDQGFAR